MTTLDYALAPAEAPAGHRQPPSLLRRWLAWMRRKRLERRTVLLLSRLDAHLLRDIGVDPNDIRGALDGRNGSLLFDPIYRRDY